jgi:hypothetical protein
MREKSQLHKEEGTRKPQFAGHQEATSTYSGNNEAT